MATPKTSTFTIHHDRCDPSKWTLAQWRLLQEFIAEPLLQRAAALSRLGIQLVLSEHHQPAGGTLEEFGFANERDLPCLDNATDELNELFEGGDDVVAIVPIYRGPTKYAVRYGVDDGHGEFGGYEFEIRDTQAEAEKFQQSLTETEPATS